MYMNVLIKNSCWNCESHDWTAKKLPFYLSCLTEVQLFDQQKLIKI
jgi:hypothetical protein